MASIGVNFIGLYISPAVLIIFQNLRKASRAPSFPPVERPCAKTTAFIAPALVAETESNVNLPSSSSLSKIPQARAP